MDILNQNLKFSKLFKASIVFLFIILSFNQVKAQAVTNNSSTQDSNIKNASGLQHLKQSITVIKNQGTVLNSSYKLVPGDILSFQVYGEPDLTQPSITIRPDGYATIEPIGEVNVAGLDIKSLTQVVIQKLSLFVRDPQISINVMDIHPASIYVYGAVQKPGLYQQSMQAIKGATNIGATLVKTELNVSNVISSAGGVTYDADLTKVVVTSESGETRDVNLWKLLSEGDSSQNILLKHGDKIYVPKGENTIQNDEDFKTVAISSLFPDTFPVRIIGEVNKAGLYDIPSKSPYINSAIASASGYNIDARKKLVIIYRKTPKGNISRINVDPNKLDFVLRPNDLVYVKERRFAAVARMCDYINRFLSPLANTGNGANGWANLVDPKRNIYY